MSAPERIQRRRTKGWRMPDGAVYVGRPTIWGNPWRVVPVDDPRFAFGDAADVRHATEDACLGRFDRITRTPRTGAAYWATRQYESEVTEEFVSAVRAELAGKDLACWCPLDQPCHADVLLELANPERHPCGHLEMTKGCGGCDPGAIDLVITDDGVRRPFDPNLDMQEPRSPTPRR